jgi:hypothetical protein
VLGGHSNEPTAYAVIFIVLAVGLRFLRYRTRGGRGGQWGGRGRDGPPANDGGSAEQPPIQWDIRKSSTPIEDAPGSSEEHNPPGDV